MKKDAGLNPDDAKVMGTDGICNYLPVISLSYVTVNLVYYDFCLCAKVGSLSLVIACLSCVTACYSFTLVIVAVCQLRNKRIIITTITVTAADAKICCIYNNDFQL